MTYKEPASIAEIIDYIGQTLKRTDISIDDMAGNIVGATLANTSIKVEELFDELPELYEVVELAADLELWEEGDAYPHYQWNELFRNFEQLKERLEKKQAN